MKNNLKYLIYKIEYDMNAKRISGKKNFSKQTITKLRNLITISTSCVKRFYVLFKLVKNINGLVLCYELCTAV